MTKLGRNMLPTYSTLYTLVVFDGIYRQVSFFGILLSHDSTLYTTFRICAIMCTHERSVAALAESDVTVTSSFSLKNWLR